MPALGLGPNARLPSSLRYIRLHFFNAALLLKLLPTAAALPHQLESSCKLSSMRSLQPLLKPVNPFHIARHSVHCQIALHPMQP
jgi:hypothetical protein